MAMSFEEAAAMLADARERIPDVPKREAREQARNARARVLADWPRETGDSGRGFTTLQTAEGARLFNNVRHAFFVNEGQAHRDIQKALADGDRMAVARITRATNRLLEG